MIQAVVFDMDGVLVNSEPENMRIVKEYMETLGASTDDAFLASLVGTSWEMTCRLCLERLDTVMTLEAFNDGYVAYDMAHPYDYGRILNPNVKTLLTWLRAHDIRIALASSSPLRLIQRMLEECALDQAFDVVTSGEMFTESKPNPEIYLHTLRQLDVMPQHSMAVEDSYYGIEAGLRAGMVTIAYRDTQYGIDQRKAHHIVDDLLDIRRFL